jgi:hypothetical protein
MARRVRPACKRPTRRAPTRLSPDQLVALDDALPTRPTRDVIRAIEDNLHAYQANYGRRMQDEQRIAQWIASSARTQRLARTLRARLPIVAGDDDSFIALLDQRIAAWTQIASRLAKPNHREPDADLQWRCWAIVGALDRAGVSLRVGRDTHVVDVLRLVLAWADARVGRPVKPRQNLHDFARAIVEGYRRSPK